MSEVIREREIKVLEFEKIRQSLAALTASPMAEKRALSAVPSSESGLVRRLHKETAEAKLFARKGSFSPSKVADPASLVIRAGKGAVLPGSDLANLMLFIKASRRWQVFFREAEETEFYPLMAEMAGLINPCRELCSELERSLDSDGNLLDSASPLLQSLRRKIFTLQGRIRDRLDQYIRSSATRKYLQEPLVTIRGDRFVIPVRQEYRQYIDGVVHDQSASGATFFIEPMPVVQMQNELTGLHRQEEQEIERILYKLSGKIADEADALLQNRSLYGELDYIVARGRLSLEWNCSEPQLIEAGQTIVSLKNATHPLLPGEKVPLNLELGDLARTLVVTGPNTGGKTVALKTVGLIVIMAQCGLQIPAEENSALSVFNRIRADIGDEQSIAQSLSTFSGHMKNIIEIIDAAEEASLILLDELGAGTDPSEGSALAMSILEKLTDIGAMTIATTHINELKLFAQVREGLQNAAMEFDPDTLTPTYRLLQGVPGQSNAFYIAGQLGLSGQILEKAKSFLHRSHDQVERVIASLVEDQQRFHRDSRQAALDRSRAELMMKELEKERLLLKERKEDILREAREEAKGILKSTKGAADRILKELKHLQMNEAEASGSRNARIEEVRREFGRIREEIGEPEDLYQGESPSADQLEPGKAVYIRSLKQRGEVISLTGKDAQVRVGSMNIHLPISDLLIEQNRANKEQARSDYQGTGGGYSVKKDLSVSSSVDLRGMNFEEALPLVEKLLDDALWSGLNRVEIIHGKGTGRLKEALRSYLKEHILVKSIRGGGAGEGGEGVTVVEIKG